MIIVDASLSHGGLCCGFEIDKSIGRPQGLSFPFSGSLWKKFSLPDGILEKEEARKVPICVLEMYSLVLAAYHAPGNVNLLFYTDSTVVAAVLAKHISGNIYLEAMSAYFWALMSRRNCSVAVKWIASERNPADYYSRSYVRVPLGKPAEPRNRLSGPHFLNRTVCHSKMREFIASQKCEQNITQSDCIDYLDDKHSWYSSQ